MTRAGAAVDRDDVTLAELVAGDPERSLVHVDLETLGSGDARLAHAARDDRGVRRHAAVRGEHALRVVHAVNVVGRRLPADEDDRLAGLSPLLGRVGVEDDLPARRARGRVEALRRDLELGALVEPRVEKLVELGGIDARDRLVAVDQPLVELMSTAAFMAAAAVRFSDRVWRR